MDNFCNKLRILTKTDHKYLELFEQANLPDLVLTEDNAEADIVLGAPPELANCIDEFTNVSWVQSTYAGVDPLTKSGLKQDYELTNVKGIFGQQISEYVLGYIISHFRHFNDYCEQQKDKIWKPHKYTTLAEKKMLILGTGALGNYLAGAAQALNLHTIGVNRTGIPPKDSSFTEVLHVEQLDTRIKEADIIVSTLPSTPQTFGMFNEQFFSSCNSTLFFNVGRGDSVETQALLDAIDTGKVEHAFLDVFINEPISQQCPYWTNPKITVTPHIAAYSFPEQVFEIFKENYLLWRDGFQLQHRIDFEKGY